MKIKNLYFLLYFVLYFIASFIFIIYIYIVSYLNPALILCHTFPALRNLSIAI